MDLDPRLEVECHVLDHLRVHQTESAKYTLFRKHAEEESESEAIQWSAPQFGCSDACWKVLARALVVVVVAMREWWQLES